MGDFQPYSVPLTELACPRAFRTKGYPRGAPAGASKGIRGKGFLAINVSRSLGSCTTVTSTVVQLLINYYFIWKSSTSQRLLLSPCGWCDYILSATVLRSFPYMSRDPGPSEAKLMHVRWFRQCSVGIWTFNERQSKRITWHGMKQRRWHTI